MTYHLLPRAEADIEQIGDFLAERNPAAAARLVDAFHEKWLRLTHFPYLGMERDDIMPGIRHVVVGEYVALYRVAGSGIEIVRVFHGHRHITAEHL
jgi:toxin ParE1/3/4